MVSNRAHLPPFVMFATKLAKHTAWLSLSFFLHFNVTSLTLQMPQLHGAPSVVLDLATISEMLQLNGGKVMAFASK